MAGPQHTFETYRNPFAGSIADMIARRGEDLAQGTAAAGTYQGRGQELSGQMWGHGVAQAGADVANAAAVATDPRRKLEALQLQEAQGRQAAGQRFDQLLTPYQPNGPQPEGEAPAATQHPYLDENGLYKIPALTEALAASGMAQHAPELLKHAQAINDSILEDQQREQKAAEGKTLLLGDMAAGALGLIKAGIPTDQALDLAAAPGLATNRFAAPQYAQIRAKLLSLPPEQQAGALGSLMDAAAKVGGPKTLSKDAVEVDRYGRTTASNMVPEKPTEASLAAAAAGGDPTAGKAIALLKPPARRTGEEQALDAYAQSIGKTKAEDLTDTDRQAYAAREEARKSLAAFAQHQRERTYDNAHPTPDKPVSQDKLEQEYRTVLTRGLSSRSGGLGLEDAKVQQANHLLSLLDQFYDPKTNTHSIPRVQLNELALGLARLTAPGGQAGVQMLNEFQQKTAAGDLAGALTYLTGQPIAANTEAITKMLRESIERQGATAETNREGEMAYLRGLAPTNLDEARRQALEKTSLNPLRQSRVIQNRATGERRLQTSTDGGQTWK